MESSDEKTLFFLLLFFVCLFVCLFCSFFSFLFVCLFCVHMPAVTCTFLIKILLNIVQVECSYLLYDEQGVEVKK